MRKINFIIIACIIVYVFWLLNPDLLIEYLGFSGVNLINGRAWTLVTSLFLHGDFLHLAGNMLFLYIFGNTLEEEMGAVKALGAFFIGGILTFPLSLLFYDWEIPLIGASAAIFTLAAIVVLIKPLKISVFLFMPQGLLAILYFAYNALAVYSDTEGNVAYVAHIIGFAIGVPFGLAWSKNWLKNLLLTIAMLIVYIIMVSIVIPVILNAII